MARAGPTTFDSLPLYPKADRKERGFYVLGEIRERFVTITRGQKIAYVVDARYDKTNERKIGGGLREADIFYCRAPIWIGMRTKPRDRYHLTARQAKSWQESGRAQVVSRVPFSPRYTGLGRP